MYCEDERRSAIKELHRALRARSTLLFPSSPLGRCEQSRDTPRPGSSRRESLLVDMIDFERAFARLSQANQSLLWLRYVEGIHVYDIARQTGRSLRSTTRDIARALDALAAILEATNRPRAAP